MTQRRIPSRCPGVQPGSGGFGREIVARPCILPTEPLRRTHIARLIEQRCGKRSRPVSIRYFVKSGSPPGVGVKPGLTARCDLLSASKADTELLKFSGWELACGGHPRLRDPMSAPTTRASRTGEGARAPRPRAAEPPHRQCCVSLEDFHGHERQDILRGSSSRGERKEGHGADCGRFAPAAVRWARRHGRPESESGPCPWAGLRERKSCLIWG